MGEETRPMEALSLDISEQLHRIYAEARDIARSSGKALGSAQLLLAMFTEEAAPNQAQSVLAESGLEEDGLIEAIRELSPEPDDTMEVIQQKTKMTAVSCDARMVNSLHLLLAICQVSSSMAYRAMDRRGVDMGSLRVKVLSYVTGVLPRRFFEQAVAQAPAPGPLPAAPWKRTRARLPAFRGALGERSAGLGAMLLTEEGDEAEEQPRPRRRPQLTGADREAAAARALAALVAETRARPTPSQTPPLFPRPLGLPARPQATPTTEEMSHFALDPKEFPVLSSLGRNLSVEVEKGRFDPLIGREEELEQVLDILHKRRANNPCLVGEPGVGKTAIGEGVAAALVKASEKGGEQRTVIEINVGSLVAGTHLRGAFAERMAGLRKEVAAAGRRIVLFIDEIHTLIGAGAGSGAMDAANDLKAALARGDFPCIGATTAKEYRQHIESDAALERRFQPITVEEPSFDEAIRIVAGVLDRYEAHHGVHYEPACVDVAVRLSARYVPDRRLPDKAINLVDLAGARAARSGRARVTEGDMARVVAKLSGIPVERLTQSDAERLLNMEDFLGERIVGQRPALRRISAMIQRNSAGFRGRRPIGSALLLGPTGVGKTETIRVLADFLFQERDALTRLDMSEFSEAHSISKLIGASPGYVGYEEGGQLTEAIHRRPYQIVLFDEVEKASREVLNLLLQVLEEGTLKDGRGRRVDFSNAFLAMTSNLGAEEFERRARSIGFSDTLAGAEAPTAREQAALEKSVLKAAEKVFSPELWNRIEEKLVYHPLSAEEVAGIARLLLRESSERLAGETGIRYDADESVVEHLVQNGGYEPRFGARPMRRTVQRLVEGALSREILAGRAKRGAAVRVVANNGTLEVRAL